MQRWIQRAFTRGDGAVAPFADPLRDLVAVQLTVADDAQYQQGRRALEELTPNLPLAHRVRLARPLSVSTT
jgi:hypothetical protein